MGRWLCSQRPWQPSASSPHRPRPGFSVQGNFTPRGRCLETFYYGSGVGRQVLLASGGWRPERLLNALQDAGQLQGEEPQVLVVSGGETLRKGRLRAGPAPSARGIPSATGLGGFGQAACPFQAAAPPPFPGLLSPTRRWDSTALVSIAWGCLGLGSRAGWQVCSLT